MTPLEVLKQVPIGTKLWSNVIGECTLAKIDENDPDYQIKVHSLVGTRPTTLLAGFTAKGYCYPNIDNVECVLWPSKDNRKWDSETLNVLCGHKLSEGENRVLKNTNDRLKTIARLIEQDICDVTFFTKKDIDRIIDRIDRVIHLYKEIKSVIE